MYTTCNNLPEPYTFIHQHTHTRLIHSSLLRPDTKPWRHRSAALARKLHEACSVRLFFLLHPRSPLVRQLALWWLRQRSKAPRRSAWRAVAPCKRQRRWVISRESPRRSTYILKSIVSRLWGARSLCVEIHQQQRQNQMQLQHFSLTNHFNSTAFHKNSRNCEFNYTKT